MTDRKQPAQMMPVNEIARIRFAIAKIDAAVQAAL